MRKTQKKTIQKNKQLHRTKPLIRSYVRYLFIYVVQMNKKVVAYS